MKLLNEVKNDETKSVKETKIENENSPRFRTGHRRIPGYTFQLFMFEIDEYFLFEGLTFEEETNLKYLEKYRDFLREKFSRLEENASTKYTTKDKRIEAQNLFNQKLSDLDKEREKRLTLRNRLRLYHLAWRTIKKYIEEGQQSSRTESILLEDTLTNTIYESSATFVKSIH